MTDKLDVAGGMKERLNALAREYSHYESNYPTCLRLIDRVAQVVLESVVEAMTLRMLPHETSDDLDQTNFKRGYNTAVGEFERRRERLMKPKTDV